MVHLAITRINDPWYKIVCLLPGVTEHAWSVQMTITAIWTKMRMAACTIVMTIHWMVVLSVVVKPSTCFYLMCRATFILHNIHLLKQQKSDISLYRCIHKHFLDLPPPILCSPCLLMLCDTHSQVFVLLF